MKKRDLKKKKNEKRGTQELKLFNREEKISPQNPTADKRDWISKSFCLHVCSLVESFAKLILTDKILDTLDFTNES